MTSPFFSWPPPMPHSRPICRPTSSFALPWSDETVTTAISIWVRSRKFRAIVSMRSRLAASTTPAKSLTNPVEGGSSNVWAAAETTASTSATQRRAMRVTLRFTPLKHTIDALVRVDAHQEHVGDVVERDAGEDENGRAEALLLVDLRDEVRCRDVERHAGRERQRVGRERLHERHRRDA